MESVQELLDALRARAGSDRKAAALVGVTQPSFSEWRRGHGYPDDERAGRIAELLQLDAAYVLAVIYTERAKTKKVRATWQRVAEKFRDAAMIAGVSIVAASFGVPTPAQARLDNSSIAAPTQYTLRHRRRWWLAGNSPRL